MPQYTLQANPRHHEKEAQDQHMTPKAVKTNQMNLNKFNNSLLPMLDKL